MLIQTQRLKILKNKGVFSVIRWVFLIGSCQPILAAKIYEKIAIELMFTTVRAADQKARINIISDFQGEELASRITSRYHDESSGGNNLVSPSDFVSKHNLLRIEDALKESNVLILISSQPLDKVYSWLSDQNRILNKPPYVSYPEIDSLLTKSLYPE